MQWPPGSQSKAAPEMHLPLHGRRGQEDPVPRTSPAGGRNRAWAPGQLPPGPCSVREQTRKSLQRPQSRGGKRNPQACLTASGPSVLPETP